MFDKLVESDATSADSKPRRRIFAASFVFVAILFAAAVVASIYAADYDLGSGDFDLAELLSPIPETAPEPEPIKETQPQQTETTTPSDRTTRQSNMSRVDEPTIVPTGVSMDRNRTLARPPGDFIIAPGPERTAHSYHENHQSQGRGSSDLNSDAQPQVDTSSAVAPSAPPKIEKRKTPVSGGVMTGKATHLPQPTYSAAARAMNAQGAVTVQITVDEEGKVISARAIDGHPLLKPAAVDAAWKARFKPTTLTGVPVKVTGIITYNFKR